MELHEALSLITAEQMSDTMHAESDASSSEESVIFPQYLRENYPEIYEFIEQASVEMPLESEDQFIYFRLGATFAAAAICRNIDRLALPSLD